MQTTLKQALEAWRERQDVAGHPSLDELYALASKGAPDASAPALAHLTGCGRCAREVEELADAIRAAAGWDIALARAAAAPGLHTITLRTAGGKYAVAFYTRADTPDEAVVTIEVSSAFQEALEGATVVVEDGRGRELLRAPIVLGRASGRVRGLGSIDYTRVVVRTEAAAAP